MSEKRLAMLAERLNAGDVFEPRCRARTVLKHMTSTWAVLTLIALRPGTLRFSQLRRKVNGVSERMLAQTLQHLVGDSLVIRHSHNVVPPHVDYALTELGHEAAERIEALTDWVEEHMSELTKA